MNNVSMAPHNPNGPLSVAQGLQAMCSIRNGHILETVGNQAEADLAAELLADPTPILSQDGHIPAPTGPGVGVRLNPEGLASRPFARYYQTTR